MRRVIDPTETTKGTVFCLNSSLRSPVINIKLCI